MPGVWEEWRKTALPLQPYAGSVSFIRRATMAESGHMAKPLPGVADGDHIAMLAGMGFDFRQLLADFQRIGAVVDEEIA